jgi:pilus assembly protein Flp/PilA
MLPNVAHTEATSFHFLNTLIRKGRIMNMVIRFLRDETGATAIEYGLIAAGISIAIIASVNGLGTKLNTKFNSINTSLK